MRLSVNDLERLNTTGSKKILKAYRAATASKAVGSGKTGSNSKKPGKGRSSGLEHDFYLLCLSEGLPEPLWGDNELRFHPTRRWRFDFAWPDYNVAVELEGGVFTHGRTRTNESGEKVQQKSRHLTPSGFGEDCKKYGEAAILGWLVIRLDTKMAKDGSGLDLLVRALTVRGWSKGAE